MRNRVKNDERNQSMQAGTNTLPNQINTCVVEYCYNICEGDCWQESGLMCDWMDSK